MKFKKINSKYYRNFWISSNSCVGVAISNELFHRYKVQVMARRSPSDIISDSGFAESDWWVQWEYPGYHKDRLELLILKILSALEQMPTDFIPDKNGYRFYDINKYMIKKETKLFDDNPILDEGDELTKRYIYKVNIK